jgi:hypothetical protein
MISPIEMSFPMAINHEELALTLLTAKTVKEAAQKLRMSEASIHRVKQSTEFAEVYNRTKERIFSESASKAQGMSIEALGVLYDIMKDDKQNPNARIQCAKSILDIGHKTYETQSCVERLKALEERSSGGEYHGY